ncbi:amidase [Aetokthonos hydrillicola Thurmond2011]|jgi:amidase|uniref:Amidase n=1 Tax=Aetokthonos hydrillicola Thurmond2011 TaxID=2712845 RepID=A0AAP5M8X4_9CYAN|nr:amidase [Aetokthonos hydrillicola]MBO3458046.1 amidase [Aetokthonos hydrillicola CCALA 1050]MBW4587119.1 amidase [Aetokthonos hydrillicola CCALA 1050]MDR9899631.1 amidase [Aetokthonos hydrillicola Thurmond2011]
MNDLVFLPAHQIAKAIRDRQVSSVEVTHAYLNQIAKYNPRLNAIVTLDAENAIAQSKEADKALAQGENWGILHGVPVTIKDTLETKGLRTTSSYQPLANYVPTQDATVVARLRAAGAIILGKTNTPQLADNFQTNSPLFGRTNNPWNHEYTPGGSTGGGASAIAAGLSPLEIGSDIGGSIRVPAHFCGIFGLKPTEHRVSTFGHIPELPETPKTIRHLQTVGPLARSVEDLRLCLSLIEGSKSHQPEVMPLSQQVNPVTTLQSYRYAWSEGFGDIPAAAETKAALQKLALSLAALGCCVEQHNQLPHFDSNAVRDTYLKIYNFELGLSQPELTQFEQQQNYITALRERSILIANIENFLSDWDVWLCPVVPVPAFTHRQPGTPIEVDGCEFPYLTTIGAYTTIFNLTGNPAVVMPFTQSRDGLPIGVQVVAQRGSDMKLLQIAEILTQVTGYFKRPPRYSM